MLFNTKYLYTYHTAFIPFSCTCVIHNSTKIPIHNTEHQMPSVYCKDHHALQQPFAWSQRYLRTATDISFTG